MLSNCIFLLIFLQFILLLQFQFILAKVLENERCLSKQLYKIECFMIKTHEAIEYINMFLTLLYNVNGHTMLKTPLLVRSAKLSNIGSG